MEASPADREAIDVPPPHRELRRLEPLIGTWHVHHHSRYEGRALDHRAGLRPCPVYRTTGTTTVRRGTCPDMTGSLSRCSCRSVHRGIEPVAERPRLHTRARGTMCLTPTRASEADPAVIERVGDATELRGSDPQPRRCMTPTRCCRFFEHVAFASLTHATRVVGSSGRTRPDRLHPCTSTPAAWSWPSPW